MSAKSKTLIRCKWAPADDAKYVAYHDTEWGVPERDSKALFAKLVLDGMQAGLSWRTILYKREDILEEFDGLDPDRLAKWTPKRVEKALKNPGIIRSKLKTNGAVKNARAYHALEDEIGSFSDYLWGFVGGKPIVNTWKTMKQVPAETPESQAMAKDLKKRGFTFCGPVIVYAFMQAVGMVNDHTTDCFRYKQMGTRR
ncbi:MAG: DNA-3-methyladenine glycosylase I [Maricaulaceae bacterium]|jgi:DNA-3-methyladenine glycosylase I